MKRWVKNAVIGGISGILNGLFGAGGGLAAVPLLEKFHNLPAKQAHATSVSLILVLSALSAWLYLRGTELDLMQALGFIPMGIVGAVLGGILMKHLSNDWLRRIFGLVMIISALRLMMNL